MKFKDYIKDSDILKPLVVVVVNSSVPSVKRDTFKRVNEAKDKGYDELRILSHLQKNGTIYLVLEG